MARSRHPNKEIEAALRYAEAHGWRVEKAKRGHNWGRILCPHHGRDGCLKFIYSTPRSPDHHANDILAKVDACPHQSA
jgi:hypothetical protein